MNPNDPHDVVGRVFDWEDIRRRVGTINATGGEASAISPEEMREIWASRAARLARIPVEEDEGEQIKLLLVRLGREIYGLDAQYVFNIRLADLITHVPRVPDWVAGVINLRGRILSVVDLQRFFGLPPAEDDGEGDAEFVAAMPYLVVVETPDMEVALLVDDVLTVTSLPTDRIQEVTGTVRGLRPEYVQGVMIRENDDAGMEGSSVLVVLDLPALLSDERLIVHEEIV